MYSYAQCTVYCCNAAVLLCTVYTVFCTEYSIWIVSLNCAGDMYKGGEEGGAEPDWVQTEREQFQKFRDR